MAIKATKKRKRARSTKSASAKGRVIKAEALNAAVSTSPSPPHSARWHFGDVINVIKMTDDVLHHQQLSLTDPFDIPQLTLFDVFRASQVVRNDIGARKWQPYWPMSIAQDTESPQCPLARVAIDRAVIMAVTKLDWDVLSGVLPPTVMARGLSGKRSMLSILVWGIQQLGHSHGLQGDLADGGDGDDFSDDICALGSAGLDDDLVFVNKAVLRAEQSGRSVIDHSPITEVLGELRRHRILDQHELSIDDVITLRQGSELLVMGKSHDVVTSEWNRVSQTARQAGFELCPWYEPEKTDLNGWEREVAGFGVGVADNEVTIMMPVRAYADLEFKLEKAACSPNPQRGARFAIEHWLSWQAPGLESQAKTKTIAKMGQVVRRTGFAAVISELELSAAYDRNLQRWICDRDDEHIESFLQAVDACS